MTKKIAIYPGTFDPITYGHMDIIRRAAKVFDTLIVAVAEDTVKQPIFSLKERVHMVKNEITHFKTAGKDIRVASFKGLLVGFALNQKANVIIRGMRAVSDFEYEFQMAYMNYKLSSEVETMFLPATESSHFISSRFVKELARLKGDLSGFVSFYVSKKLRKRFKNA